jgi:hypothetical protein
VGKDLAAQTAGSAHGPWRSANSPALSIALPNAYFDSLGIPRLTGGQLPNPPDADPHVRWCRRGEAARLPPILIVVNASPGTRGLWIL